MTTNFTNKQNISSNQNEELAPVEEFTQDIKELNEAELDAIAAGKLIICPRTGRIIGETGNYHILSTPSSQPMDMSGD